MPPSVVQTKTWFRPKGWYTEREEKIQVNRILRDDPSKGDMHNREAIGPKLLYKCISDYHLWPIYFVRLLCDINVSPVSNYMTLTLRKLGFSTLNTTLLVIPSSFISIATMLIVTYGSEFFNQRAFALLLTPLWCVPFLAVLRFWPGAQIEIWKTYAVLILALSRPVASVLTISWAASNSSTVSTRTVSAALVNIFSQTAGIISTQIYRADDAPKYHRGNLQLLLIAIGAIGMCLVAKAYYVIQNKRRDKVWNAMSKEEQTYYILNTKDKANNRLDFRFVH
ncbi:hypothetical protein AWJ20_218 [Sugiyamaella lignohabitans]|uniref:Allantoate permease n=1 Tax=Sugiyamaella lignohabitans TaxID=796027 RepID=A0A167CQM4_9ASCO|nr:uncharacterized protein AWJ20_218 [Sugiyamaella lignohabitans]ANB11990.1 hypothetical protein AWJ20_218 [Sugiyamaella lignohabitans]